ncbi:MAG: tyrosine--tRNA ligase [Planctomycetes bacterium]|jgi:tyrosyl-tRNA synthetase|nr:tyrosine--tRNA ligase [Planctomycetota bacterium]
MEKIITDREKINEVLTRGVEQIFPDRATFEKILHSGRRIRLYCGFDPSAPSLHIGNAIQLNKLSQFQELGHEVIFLIGDFTGMIGDPTDKTSTRKKMTREEVRQNSRNYEKQASAYLRFTSPNPAIIRYNSEWSDPLTFKDLIEISAHFTVQQMIQRDMFQERLKQEKPIHLHEFLYPLAQGYDSVGMDVDLEVGGNDQMFNMLCGRELMKAIKGKEKFVMTNKLLADPNGKKMGKSEGNVVSLGETPENIYGQVMAWPDGMIGPGFELCTKLPWAEVVKVKEELNNLKTNPRDLKMKLAHELARIVHGEKAAVKAEAGFVKMFQKKETPDEVRSKKLEVRSINIIDLLVAADLAGSKGEARRLIKQGGIKVDNEVVKDEGLLVDISPKEILLQRGKRQFIKVTGR